MVELLRQIIGWTLLVSGTAFFVTAALGLFRFPDVYCRLHAVAKTDTLGLGLLTVGLAVLDGSWRTAAILLLIWLLVMASGAVNCLLLARYSLEQDAAAGVDPRAENTGADDA